MAALDVYRANQGRDDQRAAMIAWVIASGSLIREDKRHWALDDFLPMASRSAKGSAGESHVQTLNEQRDAVIGLKALFGG